MPARAYNLTGKGDNMKRTMVFLLILLGLFCLTYQVQAADDDIYNDGQWRITSSALQPVANNTEDIGTASYQVNDIFWNGVLTPGSSASYKINYEVVTATTDTLAAADSGKRMIYTSTSDVTVTLPAASLGLEFTVIGAEGIVNVDPASTADTIIYDPSGTALSAGDKMTAAATGDTVTLVCGAANKWYVVNRVGSWTDGD